MSRKKAHGHGELRRRATRERENQQPPGVLLLCARAFDFHFFPVSRRGGAQCAMLDYIGYIYRRTHSNADDGACMYTVGHKNYCIGFV